MDMCTLTTFTTTLLIFTVMFGSILLVTEGRPLYRQEHGSGDLIAGADFLSMLSGMRSMDEDVTTTEEIEPVRETTAIIRETTLSSTTKINNNEARTFTENPSDDLLNQVNVDFSKESSDSISANDGLIISVRVSSSVEKKVDKIIEEDPITTTAVAILAEDHPSLIAEANKSEFSVEESEPITRNSDRNYEPLPSPQPYEGSSINKPYQETIIYHNREPNRARSVSYSTVIQSIPNVPNKPWTNQNLTDDSKPSSAAESKDYYVTSKYNPSDYNESLEKRYETSSRNYYEGTERNWGRNYPQKPYIAPKPYNPVAYPQPEQNYEVDEAVSVETNGRAHGIQNADPKTKKDDNQKVGYVVEGRNYRKYRVEERTSDGFIVGEYGVVSHDDGSLRGVRYTADGTISPRLIYDALMKFLAL